jgi:ankyrin repeat protein
MSKLTALPVELILDVADHLPANDLVHLAQSNRWLFRVLSSQVDTVALKHRIPGPSYRSSVLHWAVANNHPGLVKRLIALGATIHGFRAVGSPCLGSIQSALNLAIETGHYQVAELLLVHGAEVNTPDPYCLQTPLCTAAVYHKTELAELLLAHGADPHQSNTYKNKDTPLHCAAEFRSCELVEKLISLGVDVNARNEFGETPLHCVTIDLMDEEEPHSSSEADATTVIAKKLLDAGAKIDLRTDARYHRQTALHYAAFYGNSAVARVLLESGADVATTDAHGRTPLHLAAVGEYDDTASRRLQVAQLLLQYGADVNAKDLNGKTPLDTAIDVEPSDDDDPRSLVRLEGSQEIQSLLQPRKVVLCLL